MPPPLVLASTSPYRRALLERLGLPFACVAPPCDEEALKAAGGDPEALAARLALAKARAAAILHPQAVVIGGDQVCALGDDILHKPRTAERAVEQLLRLQGGEHRLVTALALVHPDGELTHTDITRLHMRALDRTALERYVATDLPLDCAGAYKLERRGITLFSRIDSQDHDAIVGVPMLWLTGALVDLGYQLP